jgi:hypothetical protein
MGQMPSENGEFLSKKIITLETLSSLSVLSVRQLNRLIKARVITLATNKRGQPLRGRVFLGEAIPRLFEHVRDSIVMDDPSERRYRAARARKEECAAKSAEIELDYERGKYLLASKVREHGQAMLLCCRSRLLAIPSSIARSLIGLTDFRAIYTIVENAIHAGLHEIADLGEMGQRDREQAMRKLIYYEGDEIDEGNGNKRKSHETSTADNA